MKVLPIGEGSRHSDESGRSQLNVQKPTSSSAAPAWFRRELRGPGPAITYAGADDQVVAGMERLQLTAFAIYMKTRASTERIRNTTFSYQLPTMCIDHEEPTVHPRFAAT
jgi:hypothetical protein